MSVKNEIKKLEERRKELEKELEQLESEGKEVIKNPTLFCEYIEKVMNAQNENDKIEKSLYDLRSLVDEDKIIAGDKVDLHKVEGSKYYYEYFVCLHGTDTCVGNVQYRGTRNDRLGNVGYRIFEDCRGKGYASEALKLITDKLYKDGIDKVYMDVMDWNEASKRVTEKFGGKLIDRIENYDNYNDCLIYECDLKLIKGMNNKR